MKTPKLLLLLMLLTGCEKPEMVIRGNRIVWATNAVWSTNQQGDIVVTSTGGENLMTIRNPSNIVIGKMTLEAR